MRGSVRSSIALLWRHQRLVWWIFAVNLVLAWLSSLPSRSALSAVLDHSLESAKFVTGFDVASLQLLLERPEVPVSALATSAIVAALVFFVYMLFMDGGIFAVFLEDRKLSRGEFFENCGLFFWRMFRLSVCSLVPFALAGFIHSSVHHWADKLSHEAAPERLGFFVNLAGQLVFVLFFLFVRMWFDLAQARTVMNNDRRLLRNVGRSLRLAFRSGGLYARYIGIALYLLVLFSLVGALWLYLPHKAMAASFILLELMTIKMITARLWMKASSARWIALASNVGFVPIEVSVEESGMTAGASAESETKPPVSE